MPEDQIPESAPKAGTEEVNIPAPEAATPKESPAGGTSLGDVLRMLLDVLDESPKLTTLAQSRYMEHIDHCRSCAKRFLAANDMPPGMARDREFWSIGFEHCLQMIHKKEIDLATITASLTDEEKARGRKEAEGTPEEEPLTS